MIGHTMYINCSFIKYGCFVTLTVPLWNMVIVWL
jgi:hypothetical protein